MTAWFVFLAGVAVIVTVVWIRRRSASLRAEAERREAQVLDALFAARRAGAGNGGETIDVDRIFGREASAPSPTSADDVLRAAGLQPELIALVKSPPAQRTDAAGASAGDDAPEQLTSPVAQDRPPAPPAGGDLPIPLRDLVQVFYEARGYRAVPAGQSARPIDTVLRHKTDRLRSYALVALTEPLSEATARAMLERARRIDQPRLLIAAEGGAVELPADLATQGVRVLDAATIEAQFAQMEFATVAKIRAVARQRAARRAQATLR